LKEFCDLLCEILYNIFGNGKENKRMVTYKFLNGTLFDSTKYLNELHGKLKGRGHFIAYLILWQ
jgi:hypothetical protein